MHNIRFSIDIETNGLAAGINSMISLGCAAIDVDSGKIEGTFKSNLFPLMDMEVDTDTMKWWEGFPEAYKRSTEGAVPAFVGIKQFENWVNTFKILLPVAAAWKPGFDLAFTRYYEFRYLGHPIFGRAGSGLDIKTLTAIALNQPFSETQIGKVPDELKLPGLAVHTHDALDDAIEQAYVLYNARKRLGVRV